MFKWEFWMNNEEVCMEDFEEYLKKGLIRKEEEKQDLSKSHLRKTDYNLDFINYLLAEKRFYDWIIVGCYYAVYHAALALLSIKGYSSKQHQATLCGLIHLYYVPGYLDKEDIALVAKSSLEKEDVSYFVEAKNKREIASYGISKEFNKNEAQMLKVKTILFVNKVKSILER